MLGNHSKKPCANANLSDNKPNDWDFRKKGNTTASSYFPPQRLRGNNHQTWDQYLLWNDADSLIYLLPCEFPYPPEQLFIQYDKDDWFRYIGDIQIKNYETVPLRNEILAKVISGEWVAEDIKLYPWGGYPGLEN